MNRIRLFQTAKNALLTLVLSGGVCFADDISFVETVAAIASTNMLETWEGEYAFREAVSPNGATNLILCSKPIVSNGTMRISKNGVTWVRTLNGESYQESE